MSDSFFVCGCGCMHIGDNCPQCFPETPFDGKTCKECGGKMEGDGITKVLHCEHVFIGIDVEADHDPIFCCAEDHGFFEEDPFDSEMNMYTEEEWDEIRRHEKEAKENHEVREKVKRLFNLKPKETVVAWCDYCCTYKKIFCRVSMGDDHEHLYCEGCTKTIFWFAFPPEDNPVEPPSPDKNINDHPTEDDELPF